LLFQKEALPYPWQRSTNITAYHTLHFIRTEKLKTEDGNMKKLLICGGTGFIGRNLVDYYSHVKKYEVYATYFSSTPPSLDGITFVHADLTNKDDVKRVVQGMDIIIQAAATTSGANDILHKPYYHVTDNAVMNSLILREAFENKIEHFLFFSCTVMYQPSETPLCESDYSESDEIFPSYFGVGWTKVYIEKMCRFYSKICDTKFTVMRHSNIYGPYDKYDLEHSHVFGATITKVMTAQEGSSITVWGEGKEGRDLLHVKDLVRAVDLALDRQQTSYELINIGYGSAISVADLVKKIIAISGKKLHIQFEISKPSIPTRLCLNCEKAKNLLGWQPELSLDKGIAETIAWYKENILNGEGT